MKAAFKSVQFPLVSNEIWETEDLLLRQTEQSYLFYCGLRCQCSHVQNSTNKTTAAVHTHFNKNTKTCVSSLHVTFKKVSE